jgi:hypothetical protein
MRAASIGISCFVFLFVSNGAVAAGFENGVMFSGKYAGYGAAAVSSVTGSQSLYFNPAGLVGPGDISLNYTPSWSSVNGYLVSPYYNNQATSSLINSGGGFVSYSWGKVGIGAGAYLVGGSHLEFDNLNLQPNGGPTIGIYPTEEANLTLMEYAIGGAIEVSPGFKIGAAWRFTQANFSFATVEESIGNQAFETLSITNATDLNYGGFKIGALFEDPRNKTWGIGVSYRTQQNFNTVGNGTSQTILTQGGSASTNMVLNTAIGFVLPAEFSAGANYQFNGNLRILVGVDYAQYSNDGQLTIAGTYNGTQLPSVALNWNNMYNGRIGVEYTGMRDVALRAGYVYTSQVTNTNNAKAIYTPPGPVSQVTVGGGVTVQKNIDIDGAFEYAYSSGTGMMTVPAAGDQWKELLNGYSTTTTASIYSLHLGGTYRF